MDPRDNLPDHPRVREAAAILSDDQVVDLLSDPDVRNDLHLLMTSNGIVKAKVMTRLMQRGLYGVPEPEKPEKPPILDSRGRPYSQGVPAKRQLMIESIDNIEPEEVEWLWPGRIPVGDVSVLMGRQGDGKSTLVSRLIATVSSGGPWPDCPDDNIPGSVLILSAEESAARAIRPRLDAFHYAKGKVHIVKGVNLSDGRARGCWFSLAHDSDLLDAECKRRKDVRLIVVDPLASYMRGINGYNDVETRAYLQPMFDLAEDHDLAVLLVVHPNKNKDNDILDRASGTGAITQMARMSWYLSRDPSNKERRLLSLMKGNTIGSTKTAIALHYDERRMEMTWFPDPIDLNAEDVDNLLQKQAREAKLNAKRGPDPTESKKAQEFILAFLAKAPALQSAAQDGALNVGIKESSFRKALKTLMQTDGRVMRERGEKDKRWWLRLGEPSPETPEPGASDNRNSVDPPITPDENRAPES
jgi:putative DNA primase/helicase